MEHERTNDDLSTPEYVWRLPLEWYGRQRYTLDPCSNPWSTVPAERTISRHEGGDGLAEPWITQAEFDVLRARMMAAYPRFLDCHPLIWCNPPYSKPGPWIERAIEANREGAIVCLLIKLDPTTKAARALYDRPWHVACDFNRRISFEGGAHKAGTIASRLIVLERPGASLRLTAIARAFDAARLGETRVRLGA